MFENFKIVILTDNNMHFFLSNLNDISQFCTPDLRLLTTPTRDHRFNAK